MIGWPRPHARGRVDGHARGRGALPGGGAGGAGRRREHGHGGERGRQPSHARSAAHAHARPRPLRPWMLKLQRLSRHGANPELPMPRFTSFCLPFSFCRRRASHAGCAWCFGRLQANCRCEGREASSGNARRTGETRVSSATYLSGRKTLGSVPCECRLGGGRGAPELRTARPPARSRGRPTPQRVRSRPGRASPPPDAACVASKPA